MTGKQRLDRQIAYILHSYPYSESSLILDVFSREHGRMPLLARGARRPRSALRGVLQAFQPLELGWFGGGDVRTLAKAEWLGGMPLLSGGALMLGYYLNELLLKLLARDDAHCALFDEYASTLQELSKNASDNDYYASRLRLFEKTLLRELGYGLVLEREALTDDAILPDMTYRYLIESGPVLADASPGSESRIGQIIRGKTLLDLARNDCADPRTLSESKCLMRMLINHHLSGQALQSRRVFMDLQEL